ncbi:MAG TPA: hypothetical protein VGN86_01910 [Pyrinomonadaceae bacterium]|nr:hypothetical protein [Pyrinomonadaceae bacterium]
MVHNNRRVFLLAGVGLCLAVLLALVYSMKAGATSPDPQARSQTDIARRDFDVQVVVDGRPLEEYVARGRTYVEALEGREYELRVHNPYPYRVAVSLSVDGLNSIDARHTSAWEASKWVIEPYGSIDISGWQVSSSRARHFYFTTEQDSYGAKLGQTTNLGVIAAVFYRERQPNPIRITPPRPRPIYPPYEKDGRAENKPSEPSADSSSESRAKSMPAPDDESAATGIGRSVGNDVRWVNMDLDSRAMSEVVIRYEFYQGLVRLGILPRRYQRPDTMGRREAARGFEDRRFSPEP